MGGGDGGVGGGGGRYGKRMVMLMTSGTNSGVCNTDYSTDWQASAKI